MPKNGSTRANKFHQLIWHCHLQNILLMDTDVQAPRRSISGGGEPISLIFSKILHLSNEENQTLILTQSAPGESGTSPRIARHKQARFGPFSGSSTFASHGHKPPGCPVAPGTLRSTSGLQRANAAHETRPSTLFPLCRA